MSSSPASLPRAVPGTLRISQGVSQGLLIRRVQPIYPSTALAMRIQGTVQLEATINKEGIITNLKTVSGDPVLARAAAGAVKQWRYKPYYLDGAAGGDPDPDYGQLQAAQLEAARRLQA